MRATITLDDELISRAQALSGLQERSALVREALAALIQRESARRLARLGGSEPRLDEFPRFKKDKARAGIPPGELCVSRRGPT